MDREVSITLVAIVASMALLALASKRRWLSAVELAWVGAILIVAEFPWLLHSVLPAVVATFGRGVRAQAYGVLLCLPVTASTVVVVVYLSRRLRNEETTEAQPMLQAVREQPTSRVKRKGRR